MLRLPKEQIMQILNTMGLRVQAGETFKAGDMIEGLCQPGYSVRLDKAMSTGNEVLRLIVPDSKNRFPEDLDCDVPYKHQTVILFDPERRG